MTSAIVTGSSGAIGSAIAEALAKDFDVWGLDAVPPRASAGWNHRSVDLADLPALARCVTVIPDDVGLIVHAAMEQHQISVGAAQPQLWMRSFAVSVLSVDTLLGIFKSSMTTHHPRTVVAIGSIHSRQTSTLMGPYASAKAALESWCRSVTIDFEGKCHAVNLALGAVDTPMLREHVDAHEIFARIPSQVPIAPSDVAQQVRAIIELSPHLSGTTLIMDSGASAVLSTEAQ